LKKPFSLPVLLLSALLVPAAAAGTVPLDVVHVAPLGEHQVIVYSVCSPEHCWHSFYIRRVQWDGARAQVICRAPVSELNQASDFIAESVAPSAQGGGLDLRMVSSHGIFEPAVVTLAVSGDCRYKVGKLPAAAANNSSKPTPLRGAA
jgi:hypothetical protein